MARISRRKAVKKAAGLKRVKPRKTGVLRQVGKVRRGRALPSLPGTSPKKRSLRTRLRQRREAIRGRQPSDGRANRLRPHPRGGDRFFQHKQQRQSPHGSLVRSRRALC